MRSFEVTNAQWWSFLIAIIERDLLSRYKFTKLGFYWMFVSPILYMLIIGFVFQFFVKFHINNYFVFLFIGLLVWNYFLSTVSQNTTIIVKEKALIQKSNFPREVIVLSGLFTNFVNLTISLGMVLVYLLITNTGNFKLWIWLPLPVILLVVLTTGFSFILSTLYVKNRDLDFVVSAILPLWFYGTPIIYSLDLLPKSISWLFYVNPLTFIIETLRYVLLGMPILSIGGCLMGVLMVLVVFVAGIIYFCHESPDFSDWI